MSKHALFYGVGRGGVPFWSWLGPIVYIPCDWLSYGSKGGFMEEPDWELWLENLLLEAILSVSEEG